MGISYNPSHNILTMYCLSVWLWSATSKTGLYVYLLCIRVPLRVDERLRTEKLRKLGTVTKMSKLGAGTAYCPVSPLENVLTKAVKNCTKGDFLLQASFTYT